ncbi:MAG: MFS transporter [Chloroflexi bacterium]|nr:MFS transporter [Chloroflexota bacterium]|tara:strand:+ start:344 stop:1618 length:1275 start_codon:yes stop_codon:yes gene_type:complete
MSSSLIQDLNKKYHLKHFAWVIVLIASIIQMVGSTIRNVFGVMVEPMSETFGWSQGEIGLGYAIAALCTAFFSPIAGILGDIFGAKKTMLFGTFLFLIGMILTANSSTIIEFYFSYGIVLGIAQSIYLVPIVPAVVSWFKRGTGIGTGSMMVAWSVGPALSIQALAICFENFGWQNTFMIFGIFGTLIIFICLLFFSDSPEKKGVKPYGWLSSDGNSEDSVNKWSKLNQKIIFKTDSFWHLINIHFWGCVGHAVILVAVIPMAVNQGLSLVQASGILSIIAVVSISSRFAAPIIGDKFGSKPIIFLSFLGQGLSVLILLGANSVFDFYLFAIMFGIPYGGEGTVIPVINKQYYGRFPMGTTYGWQLFGAGIGMAIGGFVPGILFDYLGNYNFAIWVSSISSLWGAVIVLMLRKTDKLIVQYSPN